MIKFANLITLLLNCVSASQDARPFLLEEVPGELSLHSVSLNKNDHQWLTVEVTGWRRLRILSAFKNTTDGREAAATLADCAKLLINEGSPPHRARLNTPESGWSQLYEHAQSEQFKVCTPNLNILCKCVIICLTFAMWSSMYLA